MHSVWFILVNIATCKINSLLIYYIISKLEKEGKGASSIAKLIKWLTKKIKIYIKNTYSVRL